MSVDDPHIMCGPTVAHVSTLFCSSAVGIAYTLTTVLLPFANLPLDVSMVVKAGPFDWARTMMASLARVVTVVPVIDRLLAVCLGMRQRYHTTAALSSFLHRPCIRAGVPSTRVIAYFVVRPAARAPFLSYIIPKSPKMSPAHGTTHSTKYKLTATFSIDADDFKAVPRGQLKQTYVLRKEQLFAAYTLPAPRVTRVQAFFGVDRPPRLTCEWIDTKEDALEVHFADVVVEQRSHTLDRR